MGLSPQASCAFAAAALLQLESMAVTYPLPNEKDLVAESTAWAVIHGLVMAMPGESQTVVTHCPFTILPSPVPRRFFDKAVALSKPLNTLVHAISTDVDFLVQTHRDVVEVDNFTRNLVRILQTVHQEGLAQTRALGICRSDYMIDGAGTEDPSKWNMYQIEINCISSSFGALSTKIANLHRYMGARFGLIDPSAIPDSPSGCKPWR